jgi:RimJ/RimL family protein N-acetyltransferase
MSRSAGRQVVELRGSLIRLRPFAPAEVEAAWHGLSLQDEAAHPRRSKDDWSPTPPDRFRRRIERSGTLWRGRLDLAIERRVRLIGMTAARTAPQQSLPQGVFEVGVVLFGVKDRGKGYGGEAIELLTRWLFEVAGAARVQAGTATGNVAMRRVLERLGFRLEGVMRGYEPMADGSRVDGAMYAQLRSEAARRED